MLDAPTQTAQKPVLRVTDLRKISLLLIILLIMTKLCNKKFNARWLLMLMFISKAHGMKASGMSC